jgi:ABC-2 type transport system permease protein
MNVLKAALSTEILKAKKSKMLWISILLFVFMGLMIGLLMLLAKHPEISGKSAVLNTKASMIGKSDWPSFLNLLIQMVLTIGYMGCGIVTIWVFGREYTDRVVKDLLALPVPRYIFVISKFIIIFFWSFVLLLLLFFIALITGLSVKLDQWSFALAIEYFRLYIFSSLLTVLLFSPVALITCISRGFLLPIAFVILSLILTQFIFISVPAIIPYFPWAIPALCSGVAGSDLPQAHLISYIVIILTSLAGLLGTAVYWRFADQK